MVWVIRSDTVAPRDLEDLNVYIQKAPKLISPQQFWAAIESFRTEQSVQDLLQTPDIPYTDWDSIDGLVDSLLETGWTPANIKEALESEYPEFYQQD